MRHILASLVLAVAAALLLAAVQPARSQATPTTLPTCQAMVRAALEQLEANCTGVGRNTACYGNMLVETTFAHDVPDDYFSAPADRADVVTLRTMSTAPMDQANDVWGVALMNVQANLPGTLPGQSVTMILLGDTVVGNAVPEADAALPADPVAVFAAEPADIHMRPLTDAPVAGQVAALTRLEADARTPDQQWVRVVAPAALAETAVSGWLRAAQLAPFDASPLPVVGAQTRTPMQAFVFRTGIGQPTCAEAPNSVVVQGPANTQVVMNVNGADLTIGSTVRLASVRGAPQAILSALNLPQDIASALGQAGQQGEETCGVMEMSVLSGAVELNDGDVTLPEGNVAYAVFCGEQAPDGGPEATPSPDDPFGLAGMNFASAWGAFRPMTEEELLALEPLEDVDDTILNYVIRLPGVTGIQPPIYHTPTPFAPPGPVATATAAPTQTPSPTPNPTIPPGTGLSTFIGVNPAANNQTATVGQPFAVPFAVTVTDPYGGPSIGVPVTFSAPASGASGTFTATGTTTQTVLTDGGGNAVASPFTGNTIAGSYTVTASAPQDVGSFAAALKLDWAKPATQATLATSFSVINAPAAPARISAAPGGDNLTAEVGATYSGRPAVLITDTFGNPVAFAPVAFSVLPGSSGAGGSFSGSAVANGASGSDGIATAPFITANTTAGAFQVSADAGFGSVNLNLTNLPGAPAAFAATFGDGQSATVGTAFANFLIARLTDSYGNGIAANSVTFTAATSGPGAGFLGSGGSSETVSTDSDGYAASSAVIANTVAGGHTVSASAGAFSASYSLTNLPGAPASMTVTGGNGQSTLINTAFATALSVSVADSYGNAATGASVTFSAPASGASGSFGGPATVTADASGIATAPALTANSLAGSYTVAASSGSVSASFSLTNLNPQPSLTSLSPNSATAGDAGFTLTLTGTDFVNGMQVTWSGQPNLSAAVGSATSATVSIPAGYMAAPGVYSVGVVNPGPGGGPSSGTLSFTVHASTVVTSLADSGPGSLRQVIADAPAGSTISFATSGTITLTSGVISIGKDLTLSGPGAGLLTISGNNTSRIFDLYGAAVSLSGLRLTAGRASGPGGPDGGAIYVFSGASLNVTNSQFDQNTAQGDPCCEKGGAIFSVGVVSITSSSFINNFANQMASAVAVWPTAVSLSITNSCLVGNTGAGGYAVSSSVPSTISGNWWGDPGGPGANGVNNSMPADSAPASAPLGGVPGC